MASSSLFRDISVYRGGRLVNFDGGISPVTLGDASLNSGR